MHRVYSQADLDVLDTIVCLNATGMKIEDMRKYITNATSDDTDAYERGDSQRVREISIQAANLAANLKKV